MVGRDEAGCEKNKELKKMKQDKKKEMEERKKETKKEIAGRN